jgi:hypothetical protein
LLNTWFDFVHGTHVITTNPSNDTTYTQSTTCTHTYRYVDDLLARMDSHNADTSALINELATSGALSRHGETGNGVGNSGGGAAAAPGGSVNRGRGNGNAAMAGAGAGANITIPEPFRLTKAKPRVLPPPPVEFNTGPIKARPVPHEAFANTSLADIEADE